MPLDPSPAGNDKSVAGLEIFDSAVLLLDVSRKQNDSGKTDKVGMGISAIRILFFVFSAIIGGCVSVSIGSHKAQKAGETQVQPPAKPFVEKSIGRADGAWQNPNNGNTISYYTSCHESAELSLEAMQSELLSALDSSSILKSEHTSSNGRDALRAEATGQVDGVPTHMQTLVFKKNGCNYSLNYVGVESSFARDLKAFQSFIDGFRAP